MVREEGQEGTGSLRERREEGAASRISKVAGGRRDREFTDRRKRGRQLRGKIKGPFFLFSGVSRLNYANPSLFDISFDLICAPWGNYQRKLDLTVLVVDFCIVLSNASGLVSFSIFIFDLSLLSHLINFY